MKIVVIGGTRLIGSKVVANLKQKGHEALAAAPNTGVNTITGEGLKEAVAGAQVVIDLANAPSWEDKAVLEFFETSGRNLLAAESVARVRHHIAHNTRDTRQKFDAATLALAGRTFTNARPGLFLRSINHAPPGTRTWLDTVALELTGLAGQLV